MLPNHNTIRALRPVRQVLTACMLITISVHAQDYGKSILRQNLSESQDKTYIARDQITFKDYTFKPASARDQLTARIDATHAYAFDDPVTELAVGARTIDTGLPVGATAGAMAVSSTGAATYHVPLLVSPGTRGMQPALGILYNSQAGNGLMGMGWNLSGLSAISRIPQTIYHDGQTHGVHLDYNDRFMLDGQRLLLTSSENTVDYGKHASVYATEIESFARITAWGAQGNGPLFFTVETKDGGTLLYGSAEDQSAQLLAADNTVIAWYLKKNTDRDGNYMTYHYTTEPTTREVYLTRIDYTGNHAAGLEPYGRIQLQYDKREDVNTLYLAGTALHQTLLLRKVQSFYAGSLVRAYEFEYGDAHTSNGTSGGQGETFYTHLLKIIEKNGSGQCYNHTLINWGQPVWAPYADRSLEDPLNANGYSEKMFLPGEFTGDGLCDVVVFSGKTVQKGIGFAGWSYEDAEFRRKFSTPDLLDHENQIPVSLKKLDMNGDGNDDILFCYKKIKARVEDPDNYTIEVYSNISGTFSRITSFNLNDEPDILTGDFDGNGYSDVFIKHKNSTTWQIKGYTVNAQGSMSLQTYSGNISSWGDKSNVVDMDGDGKAEIMVLNNGCQIFRVSGHALLPFGPVMTYLHQGVRLFPGDFNGDGLTDLLTWQPGTHWQMRYSNGKDFSASGPVPAFTGASVDPEQSTSDGNYFVGDFNGDGKADVLQVLSNGAEASVFNVFYSKGFTFVKESYNNNKRAPDQDESILGDFNGDGRVDFCYKMENPSVTEVILFHKNEQRHLVTAITDGMNRTHAVQYKQMTCPPSDREPAVYSSTVSHAQIPYPQRDIRAPIYLVEQLFRPHLDPHGNAIRDETRYHYYDARFHREGKGFLGFLTTNEKQITTQTITYKHYEILTGYHLPYLKKTETNYFADPQQPGKQKPLTKTEVASLLYHKTQPANHKVIFPFVSTTHVTTFPVPGKQNTRSTTTLINKDGNITSISTNENNVIHSTKSYSYYSAAETPGINWGMSFLPKSETVTVQNLDGQGKPAVSQRTDYHYHATGKLKFKISHADKPAVRCTTEYIYDNAFGHVVTTKVATADHLVDVKNLATSVVYDEKGRFVIESKDALNRSAFARYDDRTGSVISETGIDGHTVSHQYDGFGRRSKTTLPQDKTILHSYHWYTGNNASHGRYYLVAAATGQPTVTEYFDQLGRSIRKDVEAPGGVLVSQNEYDRSGRVIREYLPHLNQTSASKTIDHRYDPQYGRLLSTNNCGLVTTYAYEHDPAGVKTTVTAPDGRVSWRITNATGHVLQAHDDGGDIFYSYGSHGQPVSIRLSDKTIQLEYDDLGQQKSLNDPDAGQVLYLYNSFGQMKSQTDPLATYSLKYDVLGRTVQKTNTTEGSTRYAYVETGNGIGQVETITDPEGITQTYTYDTHGRVLTFTEKIDALHEFTTTYSYEDCSPEQMTVTYPSGYRVTEAYDSKGITAKITGTGDAVLFDQAAYDAEGRLVAYTTVAGAWARRAYDHLGRLTDMQTTYHSADCHHLQYGYYDHTVNPRFRSDRLKMAPGTCANWLSEQFQYDNLHRLEVASVPCGPRQETGYDASGNITRKSDVGEYGYSHSTQPHAVTNIEGVLAEALMHEQQIAYTLFNKTKSISQSGQTLAFTYGPDQARKKMVCTGEDGQRTVKYYAGSYERIEHPANGYVRELTYINGPEGLLAVHIQDNKGADALYGILKDHLGSVVGLMNGAGQVVEEYSFDAWGRRRNPHDYSYEGLPQPSAYLIDRGYTGHEHLDTFGLINMNGRMYDPLLGRMLSPDNYVQEPGNTQNYNRFSYCLNNPLIYTDPSGDFIFTALALMVPGGQVFLPWAIGADIGMWSGGSLANGTTNPFKWDYRSGKTWGYMLGGAAVGAVSGGAANAVATSGMAGANTAALMTGSYINSAGTAIYTGGQTDVSVSFGFASYNFEKNEWGYLGNRGNSAMQNIGYSLGALANVSDVMAGFKPSEVQLNTENSDAIGHSALTKVGETDPHNSLVSVGPDPGGKWIFNPFKFKNGANDWKNYVNGDDVWKVGVEGVNMERIASYGANLNKGVNYNLYFSSCVNHTARALTLAGAPAMGIHPLILHSQMVLRSVGFRPMLYSYYFNQL